MGIRRPPVDCPPRVSGCPSPNPACTSRYAPGSPSMFTHSSRRGRPSSPLHSSTASLCPVRGSPALRLLRKLRPPVETSPGLAACRLFQVRRSTRSSRVHKKNPKCVRWLAISLTARIVFASGSNTTRRFAPAHETVKTGPFHTRCMSGAEHREVIRTETSNTNFVLCADEHTCFTLAPVVALPKST